MEFQRELCEKEKKYTRKFMLKFFEIAYCEAISL